MAKVILAIIEKYFNTTRAILVVHRCNCYICVADGRTLHATL